MVLANLIVDTAVTKEGAVEGLAETLGMEVVEDERSEGGEGGEGTVRSLGAL